MEAATAKVIDEARAAVLESQRLGRELRKIRNEISFQISAVVERTTALTSGVPLSAPSGDTLPVKSVRSSNGVDALLKSLTPREIEVLRLVGEGKRTKEIAYLLGITFKTAVTHRSNIMEKLGIHEGPMLIRFAIRAGLCTP